uniref:Long iron-dependent hydrogenase 2, putative n=1 Tax=Entamoeba invadens TaxID=33085 RepID=S0AZZ7_ENTIV|nr:long iron-dependent hydrogenase 2, putative [Entamoeba invadens]
MDTQLTNLRNRTITAFVKLYHSGRFVEDIDSLPNMLCGENWVPSSRFVKSREQEENIHKERILSLLGYVAGEYDMATPLSVYAKKALERTGSHEPVFGIAEAPCNKCNTTGFRVTNMCEGCTARPCYTNCPKKCIDFDENGQARIDQNICIKCGKCAKACPYTAVIKKTIPCMAACPVNAISNTKDGVKAINYDTCINCGGCMRACPFAAILPRSNLLDVLQRLHKTKIYACPAPSIAAHFGKFDVSVVASGLVACGFTGVEEVAYGADLTATHEAEEFVEKIVNKKEAFMTTSCCPAYINAINKHIPDLKPNVSHTPTPMGFASMGVKELGKDCISVFIGPCNAKRWETLQDPNTDFCLTFDEIFGLFEGSGVKLDGMTPYTFPHVSHKEGKIFAVSGGVASAVASLLPKDIDPSILKPVVIDGFTPENFRKLKNFKKNPTGNLVEVMVCEGGCAYGPGCPGLKAPVSAVRIKMAVDKAPACEGGHWVGKADSEVKPISSKA